MLLPTQEIMSDYLFGTTMQLNNRNGLSYYLLASKRFYETIDHYIFKTDDYFNFVLSQLNGDWELVRRGIWINCIYSKQNMPIQGWKIHLSATPADSVKLLYVVAQFLFRHKVSFKFLLDKKILRITNSKAWHRGSSGKFMTIYPTDTIQFKWLLEELYLLTKDFCGPYILSDKRYKDSKVLYYRYGGIKLNTRLDITGHFIPVLVSPDGREINDIRAPYYILPDWVQDVFPEDRENTDNIAGLNNGRYIVEKALHFSNTGGIYIAYDNVSNQKVLLKEARSHVHVISESIDAIDMLNNEYRILKIIENCNIAPKPFELFKEWEHLFLVEEYFENYISLRKYVAQDSILYETRPTQEKVKSYMTRYMDIFKKLAWIIEVLHSNGIVFGDFSANNVLINPTTLDIKIVDMEGAYEYKGNLSFNLFTPGFADIRQINGDKPDFNSDYYAFGAVMLYVLTHINDVLELKPDVRGEVLREILKDFDLSVQLRQIINNLLCKNPSKRKKPYSFFNEAKSDIANNVGVIKFNRARYSKTILQPCISKMVQESCRFVKSHADYQRKDRLFPSDPDVFETNPLSLAHGAVGIMYALNKIEKKLDFKMIDWVRQHEISCRNYPPGLFLGMSGIAWGLLEIGYVNEAEDIFAKTFDHPLLSSCADIYYGIAGWGMANLKFWLSTGKNIYLNNAEKAGEMLRFSAQKDEDKLCWPNQNKEIHIGFAHGASGIGLFFLYLYSATGNETYKKIALKALAYDLAQAVEMDNGGLTWARMNDSNKIFYPYWEYGSAGIGIVCLRYFQVLNDKQYIDLVEKIYVDCDRKYTIYPGRNNGLAGIGEFLLDVFMVTKDKKYLNSAYKVASGLKIFAVHEQDGIAFPGNGLVRISCDYATGISGIMLFLNRLLSGGRSDFMLDELIWRSKPTDSQPHRAGGQAFMEVSLKR